MFLHLLPHSSHSGHGSHEHAHGHAHSEGHSEAEEGGAGDEEDLSVGLFVLLGMLTFFVIEKCVRCREQDSAGGHRHHHRHSSGRSGAKGDKQQKTSAGGGSDNTTKKKDKTQKTEKEKEKVKKDTAHVGGGCDGDDDGGIKTGGILNLIADATHNFTDGLAIASSFQVSWVVGVTTTVAVLIHEIPHEVGDFAILIQSGFSHKRAMLLQLATGIGTSLFRLCVGRVV